MRAALASVLAVFMAQITLRAETPIPGYTIVPLEWDVKVAPGQHEFLNGTVQEVYARIIELNPNFQLEPLPAGSEVKRAPAGPYDRRTTTVNCGVFRLANKGRIQEGINYLRGLPAAPRNGPGPGNCGRVSCSYNSAIYWCNDDRSSKTLDSWHMIANSAQYILQVCAPAVDQVSGQVSGQNFESGNWNTIVCSDSC